MTSKTWRTFGVAAVLVIEENLLRTVNIEALNFRQIGDRDGKPFQAMS